MYELHDEEIQHFGTKGMKWGVRKAVTTTGRAGKKVGNAIKTDLQNNANQLSHPVRYAKAARREIKNNGYLQTGNSTASKKRLISDVKQQGIDSKTPYTKEQRNKALKVGATVAVSTAAVVGALYIAKHSGKPISMPQNPAKKLAKDIMFNARAKSYTDRYNSSKSLATQFSKVGEEIARASKNSNSTISVPSAKKSSNSSKLSSLMDTTAKFAKMMEAGTLSKGQEAQWDQANKEMIDIFKKTNPYMK